MSEYKEAEMVDGKNENQSLEFNLIGDRVGKPRSLEWTIQPIGGPTLTCWPWDSPTFIPIFQSWSDGGGHKTPYNTEFSSARLPLY